MIIHCLVLGDFQSNCYVIKSCHETDSCIVIDPGLTPDPLMDFLAKNRYDPTAILLTHGHIDHIAGIPPLLEVFPKIKVYIHSLDGNMLKNEDLNLSTLTGEPLTVRGVDYFLEDGLTIPLSDLTFKVIHTPGHTPGGICLYIESEHVLFSGDTLFAGSVGRTDFPGGSMDQLLEGIRRKLLILPNQTVVYPGHGPKTTIGHEKTHNSFLV